VEELRAGSGLRSVEHILVGHYGLRVRIVDPYINMARLGSMQRDGHSYLALLFEFPKSHVLVPKYNHFQI
jgi:hypothetical protein